MTLGDIGKAFARYRPFVAILAGVLLLVVVLPGRQQADDSQVFATGGSQSEATAGDAADTATSDGRHGDRDGDDRRQRCRRQRRRCDGHDGRTQARPEGRGGRSLEPDRRRPGGHRQRRAAGQRRCRLRHRHGPHQDPHEVRPAVHARLQRQQRRQDVERRHRQGDPRRQLHGEEQRRPRGRPHRGRRQRPAGRREGHVQRLHRHHQQALPTVRTADQGRARRRQRRRRRRRRRPRRRHQDRRHGRLRRPSVPPTTP